MKSLFLVFLLFIGFNVYSQESQEIAEYQSDFFYDFGVSGGITVYADRPMEFTSDSIEAFVLNRINGFQSDREQFIGRYFLEEAGFRRTGNVRFRQTTGSERALSLIHGVAHMLSLELIPRQPFFEVEFGRLPQGEYYNFNFIINSSRFRYASPEVLLIIELEYLLQIIFFNGRIIQDNVNYYTDENINRFEELIFRLPEYPESILQARNRYLNELQRIRVAYERYQNPSENYLRAIENLRGRLRLNPER